MTLTDGVRTLLLRVGGRLTQYRQAVVVDVNSDVLGLEPRQFERCCHGVGIGGFMDINSREIK